MWDADVVSDRVQNYELFCTLPNVLGFIFYLFAIGDGDGLRAELYPTGAFGMLVDVGSQIF